MQLLQTLIQTFFQFQAYVMLPVIVFIIALISRMSLGSALLSSLKLAAGFAGIFIAFDFFVEQINPAVATLVEVRGLDFPILDVGWPPLAAITWASPVAHLSIPLIIAINVVMLTTNLTKTIYLDIWNYWHFALLGAFVLGTSESLLLGLIATSLIAVYAIKMSDWTGVEVYRETGLEGITLSPLSSAGLLPYAVGMDWLIDRIPLLRSVTYNPEKRRAAPSIFGEPMVIGAIVGALLGLAASYSLKEILELCVHIAAVMFILPKCGGLIGEGMGTVSVNLRQRIVSRFPKKKGLLVALDTGVVMHHRSILTTGIILMPAAILIALVLPGNRTLPLGDLPSLISQVAVIVLICRGNVFRSVLTGIPLVVAYLLIATRLAPMITRLSLQVGASVPEGVQITAMTDGGNPVRFWMYMLFQGNSIAVILIPVVILLLVLSRRRYRSALHSQQED